MMDDIMKQVEMYACAYFNFILRKVYSKDNREWVKSFIEDPELKNREDIWITNPKQVKEGDFLVDSLVRFFMNKIKDVENGKDKFLQRYKENWMDAAFAGYFLPREFEDYFIKDKKVDIWDYLEYRRS